MTCAPPRRRPQHASSQVGAPATPSGAALRPSRSRMAIAVVGLLFALTAIGYADNKPLDEWRYPGWPTDAVTALTRCLATHSIPVTMFAAFRTEWLRENRLRAVGFPGYRLAADTATCIRWLKAWPRIRYIPEVLFWYRQHGGQETHAINADRSLLTDAIDAFYSAEFDRRTIDALRGVR